MLFPRGIAQFLGSPVTELSFRDLELAQVYRINKIYVGTQTQGSHSIWVQLRTSKIVISSRTAKLRYPSQSALLQSPQERYAKRNFALYLRTFCARGIVEELESALKIFLSL